MTVTSRAHPAPLRVALVNDYELVLRGLAQMFRPYRDRIAVVELDARMPVSRPVDIALYDPHGRPQSEQLAVEELMAQATVGKVVVIALITQGLTNQAIADLTYLSINSVKSYIRTAYRRMSVTSRSQAVLWGVQHGFEPDHVRIAS